MMPCTSLCSLNYMTRTRSTHTPRCEQAKLWSEAKSLILHFNEEFKTPMNHPNCCFHFPLQGWFLNVVQMRTQLLQQEILGYKCFTKIHCSNLLNRKNDRKNTICTCKVLLCTLGSCCCAVFQCNAALFHHCPVLRREKGGFRQDYELKLFFSRQQGTGKPGRPSFQPPPLNSSRRKSQAIPRPFERYNPSTEGKDGFPYRF